MKKIFLFPGQGSQAIGMGKDFYDNFSEARAVFDEVDESLQQKLSSIIFEGPEDQLTLTENTQPALMAVSIAMLRVLEKETNKNITDFCDYVAGHSLGEYTALCAASAFSLSDTAKLLRIRGKSMQEAVPNGKGAMAAIIANDYNEIENLVEVVSSEKLICEIANDNGGGQVVISGQSEAISRAEELAQDYKIKRFIKLNVSAPFHSSMIKSAQEKMKDALAKVTIKKPLVDIIANVTSDICSDPEQIRDNLVQQVTGKVRWRESMEKLKSIGVNQSIEIGSGKVLSGLMRRIDKEIEYKNITDIASFEEFLNNF